MVGGTLEAGFFQVGDQSLDGALVDALALRHGVEVVEELEEHGAGLVDGADHRSTGGGYLFQKHDALFRGDTV